MCNATEQQGAHGDVDHGLGHVEALLLVADQSAPADHPAEGALHDRLPQKRGAEEIARSQQRHGRPFPALDPAAFSET